MLKFNLKHMSDLPRMLTPFSIFNIMVVMTMSSRMPWESESPPSRAMCPSRRTDPTPRERKERTVEQILKKELTHAEVARESRLTRQAGQPLGPAGTEKRRKATHAA